MLKIKEITLLKRNRKIFSRPTYDIVVVIHTKISNKVIVKLGSYDLNTKILVLNVFRLIYWFSKKYYISYRLMKLFYHINFFDKNVV